MRYDEIVEILNPLDGVSLGRATFVGQADQRGARWYWEGLLLDASSAMRTQVGSEVELRMEDGARGKALVSNLKVSYRRDLGTTFRYQLVGNSMPPRISEEGIEL